MPTISRSMNSTIQVVINGNQIEGQIDQIAQILGMVSNTVTQPSPSPSLVEELLPFNQFSIRELTPHFGQTLAEDIVERLERCANSYTADFRNFIGMYRRIATIEQRQLLKTISAIYRFKFGSQQSKCAIKSEIKYATICPHCGLIAKTFVNRMILEGLWTV